MIPLTRHGWREMLIGSLILIVAAWGLGLIYWPLALIMAPFLIWLFAFFRDPNRLSPVEPNAVVSPADGKVSDITEIEHDELIEGPAVRVGIFLSVFNVHVNRCPCDGRVTAIEYKAGKFINAMKHGEASDQNESNTIVLAEPTGTRTIVVVKQIVGMIARRIVCTVSKGELVERGERIGMIKFGSRTELTIAKWLEPKILVEIGQRVRGAADVIAVLGKAIEAETPSEELALRETPA
ncbi:MAG: phosphatidylserine decarboxylase [Tepidisphaeraceae bacterium]